MGKGFSESSRGGVWGNTPTRYVNIISILEKSVKRKKGLRRLISSEKINVNEYIHIKKFVVIDFPDRKEVT